MSSKIMEGKEEDHGLQTLVVALAINGNRKSKYIVKWSLDKFIPEGIVSFQLIHVRPRITSVPTPMGNSLPISQVRDDVAAAYKKEIEWQTSEMLLPYKQMLSRKKVLLDVVVIESDDVPNAISEEVAKSGIGKLVIGASSRGLFSRKLKGLSSRISVCAPGFCTVYAVLKGKLASIRPPDRENSGSIKDDKSGTISSIIRNSSYTSSSQTDHGSFGLSNSHFHSPSLPMQRFQALSTVNQTLHMHSKDANHSRCQSPDTQEQKHDYANYSTGISDTECSLKRVSSWKSLPMEDPPGGSDQASTSKVLNDHSSCDSQDSVEFELEKLRIELRHARGMYAMAQNERIDASRKLNNLIKRRSEEAMKLKEISIKEETAKELARQEKEKYEAAKKEAAYLRECVERESFLKRHAEMKALRDSKEKEKLETALTGPLQQYQHFSWEEIVSATSYFAEDLKIGMGAYGTVYKSNLHHTTAAVKVLHSRESHKNKQFLQELEILSKMRHPHLLLLLGACQDRGCLVYEYMKNGSLEDRLLQKNQTPPISWFDRFRIAWEVASALVFLHSSKPKPFIHRDLKPANILLDHNLVSKIGDVGLSTMLSSDSSSISTTYKDTRLVGTLCYIDPEYQRTGLISPKSDVYAFGMVMLQLITAKPAIALTHVVETAINDGDLVKILDMEAGNWPVEETKQFAVLGLSCAELRRKDRPDLKDHVLPQLERLKDFAEKARVSGFAVPSASPNHFVCPILKDVMNDPCVAADGYTYDRKAIEKWLQENDKSPMTNLPLPYKNLVPNYTLLSAIIHWKSKKT